MSIKEQISIASDKVRASSTGTLSLGTRLSIWREMNHSFGSSGHWRRVLVNLITVSETALPLWDKFFPSEMDVPRRYLGLCGCFLNGSMTARECHSLLTPNMTEPGDFVVDVEHLESKDATAAALAVAAAQDAAGVAGNDEICLDERTGIDTSMVINPDPYQWDAHFVCSMIAARGAEWEATSSADARRTFWERWLRDVVSRVCAESTTVEALKQSFSALISEASQYPSL